MKFTKENAVEKLNQILTNDGKKPLRMSERTLSGQTETLMSLIATEEMELDEFVDKVKVSLESINSNIEHDVANSIKEYEKAHPAQPKPQETKEEKPADANAELLARLAALEQNERERTAKAALEAKRQEIKTFLSNNNVKDKEWVEMALKMTTISEQDTAEDKGKSLLEFYNKSVSSGSPVGPKSPKPGDGSADSDSFSEVRNLRKQRNELNRM